jgi:mannose-6-phosphate isomerase-like protein (cupin superfamily)
MSDLQTLPTRESIDRLQEEISKLPQARVRTEHRFADGMYLREYTQFPDMLVVSKIHKRENFFIVTKGRAWVAQDGALIEIKAGDIMVTKPGTKRAVLTRLEEVTIVTVHSVGRERNLDVIEKRLTDYEEPSLFDVRNNPKPGVLMMESTTERVGI